MFYYFKLEGIETAVTIKLAKEQQGFLFYVSWNVCQCFEFVNMSKRIFLATENIDYGEEYNLNIQHEVPVFGIPHIVFHPFFHHP